MSTSILVRAAVAGAFVGVTAGAGGCVEPDVEAIEHLVGALKAEIDRPPTDAKLDLSAHATIPDVLGAFVDFDGGVVLVAQQLRDHALESSSPSPIDVPTLAVHAKVTA